MTIDAPQFANLIMGKGNVRKKSELRQLGKELF